MVPVKLVYDDPEFFAQYRALRMSDTGLNGICEEPAIRRRIGDPAGLRVLDIGCGLGQQAAWLLAQGAARVLAIDPSRRMIDAARRQVIDPRCDFALGYIEEFATGERFDLVTSSMALHYVEDLDRLLARVAALLEPDGRFVFSMEHPVCTAFPDGYHADGQGPYWRLADYFERGRRTQHWFVDGVEKVHRTLSDIIGSLLAAGFSIRGIDEPVPVVAREEMAHPRAAYFWTRPSILVVEARQG